MTASLEVVQTYLQALPQGLDSYPETTVKVSVVEAFIEGHDRAVLAAALSPEVSSLARGEIAVTQWVPEVHANVVFLGLRALFFDSDDAFVADARARNERLLRSPLYRVLMRLLSPARLHKGSGLVFGHMHRGVTVEVDTSRAKAQWMLRFPPRLVPPLLARCYATAAVAALKVSQRLETTTTVVAHTDTELLLEIE